MEKLIIRGGKPLYGEVNISGMKNSAFFFFTAAFVLLAQIVDVLVSAECIMYYSDHDIKSHTCDQCYDELSQEQLAYDRRADC